jgi:hypothetical protein
MATIPSPARPTPSQDQIKAAAWRAAFIGTMNAMALVLTARLIVLMAVIGAGILTYIALQNADQYKLIALAIYCGGVVGSTVWLAGR